MTIQDQLSAIAADAEAEGQGPELVTALVATLALAALDLGVEGFEALSDQDADRFREALEKSIHRHVIQYVARINGG